MLTVLTVSAYIELYSLHRPSAGIGRRIGLKIRWPVRVVRVQVSPRAPFHTYITWLPSSKNIVPISYAVSLRINKWRGVQDAARHAFVYLKLADNMTLNEDDISAMFADTERHVMKLVKKVMRNWFNFVETSKRWARFWLLSQIMNCLTRSLMLNLSISALHVAFIKNPRLNVL